MFNRLRSSKRGRVESSMWSLTLHKVEDPKVALLCVYGEDEVQRGIMPINQLRALPPLGDYSLQVVAKGVRALRDLLKNAVYHAFLGFFADLRVFVSTAGVFGVTHHRPHAG